MPYRSRSESERDRVMRAYNLQSMSESDQDHIIASTARERADAKRKLNLVGERLRAIGRELTAIGHALNPLDSAKPAGEALESNLRLLRGDTLEVLNRDLLQALIRERNELEDVVASCTEKLRGYGAE